MTDRMMHRWTRSTKALFLALFGALFVLPSLGATRLETRPSAVATRPDISAHARARFARFVGVVEDSNVPELVGEQRWHELVEGHRPVIEQARSHREFAEAVNALINAAGVSHFHYYTANDWSYWHLRSAFGPDDPDDYTAHVGLFTERIDGRWFVRGVLEGSVAGSSSIRVGDELLSADDRPFEPVASFRGKAGKPVHLRLRRKPGLVYNVVLTPVRESLHRAMQRAIRESIRIVEHADYRFAYLHGWTLLGRGGKEYQQLLDMQDQVDGLLLDYRDGFGGITQIARRFLLGPSDGGHRTDQDCWTKPVVILIADGTRSAKEIVVDAVQRHGRAPLVGTPTPGHVVSVGAFRRIGPDALVMLPAQRFALEGNPTVPDYIVERPIPYTAGADPQLEWARDLLADLIAH